MAMITYLKLKHDTFGGNMKVLLGNSNWRLGTKDPRSDPADKTFLGLCYCQQYFKVVKLSVKNGVKTSR